MFIYSLVINIDSSVCTAFQQLFSPSSILNAVNSHIAVQRLLAFFLFFSGFCAFYVK